MSLMAGALLSEVVILNKNMLVVIVSNHFGLNNNEYSGCSNWYTWPGLPGPVSEDGGSPLGDRHQQQRPMCPECGRVYSTSSNLKQHIANVHAKNDYWEPCHICGKMFKTRQYLHTHLLQTHGIRQRGTKSYGGIGTPTENQMWSFWEKINLMLLLCLCT